MVRLFLLFMFCAFTSFAQPRPQLQRIYFNLYTDSIKPVLNYYVNVEGEYRGRVFMPLDTATVTLRASWGVLCGMEWQPPKTLEHPSVTFYVVSRENPMLKDSVTIFIQKGPDPEDEALMRRAPKN